MVFYSIFFSFEMALRKRFKRYNEFAVNKLKSKYSDPIMLIVAVLVLTNWALQKLSSINANKIISGTYDEFNVQFTDIGTSSNIQSLALLGSTSRYAYFYDITKSESLVIPVENVSFMSKIISTKKQPKIKP
jgi:hypothetical protein